MKSVQRYIFNHLNEMFRWFFVERPSKNGVSFNINGVRGNVAVVVKKTNKNYYHVHRILTPDGLKFEVAKKIKTDTVKDGGVTLKGSLATSDSSVSTDSKPQKAEAVKKQYSLKGYDKDGVEIYETTENTLGLTKKEKRERLFDFIELNDPPKMVYRSTTIMKIVISCVPS